MNRKEFLERLIKEVDLSGPNKEEIAAELNKKINDFMSCEDTACSKEVDDDEEEVTIFHHHHHHHHLKKGMKKTRKGMKRKDFFHYHM